MKDKRKGKTEEVKGKVTKDKAEELKGKARQETAKAKETLDREPDESRGEEDRP